MLHTEGIGSHGNHVTVTGMSGDSESTGGIQEREKKVKKSSESEEVKKALVTLERKRGGKPAEQQPQMPHSLHTSSTLPHTHYAISRATESSDGTSVSSTLLSTTASLTPSNVRRRMFEARIRQLLEDEGEVFRKQLKLERQRKRRKQGGQEERETGGKWEEEEEKEEERESEGVGEMRRDFARQLKFSERESSISRDVERDKQELQLPKKSDLSLPLELLQEGQRLLTVPEPDTLWYKGQRSPDISYREKLERVLGGGDREEGEGGGGRGTGETGEEGEEEVSGGGKGGDDGEKMEIQKHSFQDVHCQGDEHKGRGQMSPAETGDSFFSDIMATINRRQSTGSESVCGMTSEPSKPRNKKKRKVRFSPESIILSASLEGELETVRECVKEVRRWREREEKGEENKEGRREESGGGAGKGGKEEVGMEKKRCGREDGGGGGGGGEGGGNWRRWRRK